MKSKQIGRDRNPASTFAKLLDDNFQSLSALKPGDHQHVKITNTRDKEFVYVVSEAGHGVIRREELLDGDNHITVNEGEKIVAFFSDTADGEKVFTTQPTGAARAAILNEALTHRLPLRGRVTQKIKGGFEVQLGEVSAFCPASQIEEEEAARKDLEFLVTEASGKRVIASRRAWRNMQRERRKEDLMESLSVGDVVTGPIVSLRDFGVFVDLGGIEGLIPTSELDFTRVGHPSEVVKNGEEVRVKVLGIDWKENRITLSRRAMLANPWQGGLPFKEGEILEGTVEGLKPFGIFVRLPGNFNGLIPASESGVPRGQRFEGVFEKGQKVRVMVDRIDRDKGRISLSVGKVSEADTRREYEAYITSSKEEAPAENVSSFGRALMESLKKKGG